MAWPNWELICLPAPSKRAAVLIALNCVWLKTLYASTRRRILRVSPSGIFLMRVMSQLLIPGPRKLFGPQFPNVPFAGIANAAGLIHCAKVLGPLFGSTPATQSGRARIFEPLISPNTELVTVADIGCPVAKVKIPESSQLSNAPLTTGLGSNLLALGRVHW